jgi:hypothetical protein
LFVIFCSGGIDFVGGYSYYQFLKNNIVGKQQILGKISLTEETGEEIHAKIFEKGEVKAPAYWKKIISYY